jgi:putative Mn2+ efflux pump MntP
MSGYIGEFVSYMLLALALGMDAFSVSLGLGMQKMRLKRIAIIGLVIGLFHILTPFLGIVLGKVISAQMNELTALAGGLLLVGIGAQMLFSAFNRESAQMVRPISSGFILLAFGVSIDSFPVGLSLGISGVKTVLALLLFGAVSMVLSWLGMMMGRKMSGLLGAYSEMLGGSILIGFGLHMIF